MVKKNSMSKCFVPVTPQHLLSMMKWYIINTEHTLQIGEGEIVVSMQWCIKIILCSNWHTDSKSAGDVKHWCFNQHWYKGWFNRKLINTFWLIEFAISSALWKKHNNYLSCSITLSGIWQEYFCAFQTPASYPIYTHKQQFFNAGKENEVFLGSGIRDVY